MNGLAEIFSNGCEVVGLVASATAQLSFFHMRCQQLCRVVFSGGAAFTGCDAPRDSICLSARHRVRLGGCIQLLIQYRVPRAAHLLWSFLRLFLWKA